MREFFEHFQILAVASPQFRQLRQRLHQCQQILTWTWSLFLSHDNFDDEPEDYNETEENDVPAVGYDLFKKSNGQDNRVVVITDISSLQLPKIFEDQTKFSPAVSENLAEFINSACTRKADVFASMEANSVPVNCKSLVPPLINQEILSYLYPNSQQRDKSM